MSTEYISKAMLYFKSTYVYREILNRPKNCLQSTYLYRNIFNGILHAQERVRFAHVKDFNEMAIRPLPDE